MENNNVENAIQDINLIKQVIQNTKSSFAGLSRIFIYWGILVSIYSFLNWLQTMNIEKTLGFYKSYPIANYFAPLLLVAFSILIYLAVTKNIKLIGLEKTILTLWMLIIITSSLPVKTHVIGSIQTSQPIITQVNNISIVSFGLGTALVITYLLTDLKNLKYIGIIYMGFGMLHGFVTTQAINTLGNVLVFILLPFTLIYTGIFLKRHHERSLPDGCKIDS